MTEIAGGRTGISYQEKNLHERFNLLLCQNPDCKRSFIIYSTFTAGDTGEVLVDVQYFPAGNADWPAAFRHASIPEKAQAYFEEAMKCRDASALRASFIMLRATLQLIIRAKGITANTLKLEIDRAKTQLRLPEEIFDIADLQRLVGNDYAHPDIGTPDPQAEDLEDFIEWLGLLADYLFVAPAKRAAIRQRRASLP